MTNRIPAIDSWATSSLAQVTDAELDTSHPSGHGGPGKTAKGWVTETEPHQWENFNIKLGEDRQKAVLTNGRIPWDSEVSYKLGALTYLLGTAYVSLQTSNLNNPPTTATSFWGLAKFTTAAIHDAAITSATSTLTAHTTPNVNAHNDNILTLGGNVKTAIDSQINTIFNDYNTHTLRLDNPHADTATNIGTVPVTGGNFTGQVNYLNNLSIGTTSELMVNATTFVDFKSNAGAIGIGIADYHTGGRWQQILTAASYPSVNALFNPTFVLPKSDLHFPMMNSLIGASSGYTITFTRGSTLAYTDRTNTGQTAAVDTPAFESNGLKLAAGTAMLVSAPGLFGTRDGCISYTLNNIVVVKDVQFTSANLTTYFGVTGNVKNFRVWSVRLTPRQKLRIPR